MDKHPSTMCCGCLFLPGPSGVLLCGGGGFIAAHPSDATRQCVYAWPAVDAVGPWPGDLVAHPHTCIQRDVCVVTKLYKSAIVCTPSPNL
jgi:hypothetical protein